MTVKDESAEQHLPSPLRVRERVLCMEKHQRKSEIDDVVSSLLLRDNNFDSRRWFRLFARPGVNIYSLAMTETAARAFLCSSMRLHNKLEEACTEDTVPL